MTVTSVDPGAHTQPATPADKKRVQGGLLDPKMLWKSTPVSYTHLTLPTNREV